MEPDTTQPGLDPAIEARLDACANLIKVAFDNNDMDLFRYALSKYNVQLSLTPGPEQPSQSESTDGDLADPEE
jgi:hypothetical protein